MLTNSKMKYWDFKFKMNKITIKMVSKMLDKIMMMTMMIMMIIMVNFIKEGKSV